MVRQIQSTMPLSNKGLEWSRGYWPRPQQALSSLQTIQDARMQMCGQCGIYVLINKKGPQTASEGKNVSES